MMIRNTLRKFRNKFLCYKYPFLEIPNCHPRYLVIWLDFLTKGWKKAFGKKLCRDLRKLLKKQKLLKEVVITNIKEKRGLLIISTNIFNDDIENLLLYYEYLSACYCGCCGKPVRYVAEDFKQYICENCAKESRSCRRLTRDDIPKLSPEINWVKKWGLKNEK